MADKMPQIVCVGRKYGSGGREIGEHLAERLGVPCYDKLLIKKTAAESGLSEDFIRQEEETPAQSRWFLSGNAFADTAALSDAFYSGSQMIYDAEQKVIQQLAEKGPCVIVGRCGDYVLREYPGLINVFICADREDRIRRIAQRYDMSERKAAEKIKRIDRERRYYYESHTGMEWGSIEAHQVLLNVSRLGLEGTVDLLEMMYRA